MNESWDEKPGHRYKPTVQGRIDSSPKKLTFAQLTEKPSDVVKATSEGFRLESSRKALL